MSRFPSDAHFASWAAQCPGNHQSGEKRRSGKTRKGPKWLDGALHDAAMGAIRVKDGHFTRKYRRIKSRIALRAQSRDRRDQTRDPDRALPHAHQRRALPPPDRSPRRRAQTKRTNDQTTCRSTRTPRAHRHATNGNDRGGGRTLNYFPTSIGPPGRDSSRCDESRRQVGRVSWALGTRDPRAERLRHRRRRRRAKCC